MEQCSWQCIRRTFYAVMVGVSPIVLCLVFIGLARLILNRLEIAYYRRQKPTDRRSSLATSQSGRLALSYTPVSNAELQRIIQGDYQTQHEYDSSVCGTPNINNNTRRTARFIKSILPKREPTLSPTSILANLVIRRDALTSNSIPGILAPIETPLHPTFSIINEQEKRRPSIITIKRESIETTTLAAMNNSNTDNDNSLNTNESIESQSISKNSLMTATKKMITTTTVVVEDFLEFQCGLSLLNTVAENDNDANSEINNP